MQYPSLIRYAGNAVRLAEVLQVFVKHGFADLLRRLGVYSGLPAKLLTRLRLIEAPGEPQSLGRRMRTALTELGPTFVKFGQILSTRPDLIGNTLCDELKSLQDQVDPVPFDAIEALLIDSLGAPIENHFTEFDREPVAAASLSQVYRARLKSGAEVAVKVQRPDIAGVIRSDLSLMRGVAEWLDEHVADMKWADPVGVVDEFARSMWRELDFTVEERVIERFARNFAEDPQVFVPKTYPNLCSEHVLVMDWIAGARVDELSEYPRLNADPIKMADIGCEAMCRQIFEHRLFHADPHPGNIRALPENRIAFIDYGMVGHLQEGDLLALLQLLRAITEEDTDACVYALLNFTTDGDVTDLPGFRHDVGDFLMLEVDGFLRTGQIGKVIERIIDLLRRHKLELAPRLYLLLKTLATIESTGRTLNPHLDMTPILRRYVTEALRRQYTPRALKRELQHNLEAAVRLARNLPADVQSLLRMLRRGRIEIQLNHERLNEIVNITDRASNRIAFAVVCGSLIVGSSWLLSTDAASRLGLVGYVVAGFLGVALALSILRSKRY